MEKFIELLNEYERKINPYSPSNFSNYKGNLLREKQSGYYDNGVSDSYMEEVEYSDSIIISKKFGFIKWLVENEKIDYKELPYLGEYGQGTTPYESLLMLLAISDEPINFLISILKSQSDERVNGAINTLREVPEK